MRKQSGFLEEQKEALMVLNISLKQKTGIDFIDKISKIALNDKKTELDVKDFIKKNYPTKTSLTADDHENLALLLDFYFYAEDGHDEMAKLSAVTYGCSDPLPTPDDQTFRSRYLRHLFPRPDQLQLCADVVGFFPK